MHTSISLNPITVLGIACPPAVSQAIAGWLGDPSRYRWMLWESDDSFALDADSPPQVIVLGQATGVASLTALAAQWPTAEVVVVLEPEQEAEAAVWLDQGAADYWVISQITAVRVRHTVRRIATQVQRLEQRLAAQTAELHQVKFAAERADSISRQQLADLSQDMQMPLKTILGFSLMLLQNNGLPPQQRQVLDAVYASGERLLSLINSALAAPPEPLLPPARGQRRAVALAPGSPTCRILIVESDFINRVLLQTLLAPLGFELQVATSVREAILQWAEWQPHLICIATALDGLDGYETVRRLRQIEHRQLRPETPPHQFVATQILALVDDTRDDAFQLRGAGCNGWLEKPIQPEVLLEKIAACLALDYVYASEPDLGQAVQFLPNSAL